MTRKHPHPAVSINRRRDDTPPTPDKVEEVVAKQPLPKAIIHIAHTEKQVIDETIAITKKAIEEIIKPAIKFYLPITVVCVNYKTEWLTRKAIKSFRKFYPKTRIIMVDNFSCDKSTKLIQRLGRNDYISSMIMPKNIGHGPAMDNAIRKRVQTPYVFLLDSDTETIKTGFLEIMMDKLEVGPLHYAIGWKRYVNTDGVSAANANEKYTPYIHPYAALIKVELYLKLPPFEYHGAPCLANMTKAKKLGYKVHNFSSQSYIKHLVAGTRRMWKGAWNVRDKPKLKEWNKEDNHLI